MINVTKTFLPPFEEYKRWLIKCWDNNQLSNRGPLVQELEDNLNQFLGTSWILLTNNGTLPIQIAIRLMTKSGEIITTPFSYVATTSSIVWEQCTPVFADIEPKTFTIDPTKVEEAITDRTQAILATHVFGNPCDINALDEISKRYNIPVIYDAAHAFGVRFETKSIFQFGDISTCSFHATKLFHTGEGGAVFCNDKELQKEIFYTHNFGHDGHLNYHGLGINGKMSELQAAMGLALLPYIDELILKRKSIVETYKQHLNWGDNLNAMSIRSRTKWNFSYFPIILKSEESLLSLLSALKANGIHPRRYFYPSLNALPYVQYKEMPISESIAKRVLCLPLYATLSMQDVEHICEIVNGKLTC